MAARWTLLGKRILLGVGLVLVLAIVVPPARLHSLNLEGTLAQRLGYPVHVGGAHWRWNPWPTVELRDAVAYPRGPWELPIAIRARKVLLRVMPSLLGADRRPYPRVEFSGLDLSLGPLGLRDAVLRLEDVSDTLRVRGRAQGAKGGSVEISGSLGGTDPALDPLRIYLAQLELPLLELLPGLPDLGGGPMSFSGVITVAGDLEQRQEIDLDLEGIALHRGNGGDWLQTTVRGQLTRRNGRFQSGPPLRIHGEVRELDASREFRAMHGIVDLRLELAGDRESGRLVVDADLDKLRLRIANVLEKPADAPGAARYEVYWAPNGNHSSLGLLELGGMSVRLDRVSSKASAGWRLRSLSLPLAELRQYVPALHVMPDPARGELAIDILWRPERGIEGEVVLRDVQLAVDAHSIEIPFASVSLTPDGARFRAPQVVLADQSMSVDGSVEWVPSSGRTHLRVTVRADHLDLESLMEVTAPLWARSEAAAPRSGTDMGTELVLALRSRPRLLARLQIDPAILEVGRLTGFGLDAVDARYRLELSDKVLRLEQGNRSSRAPQHRYALDLRSWVPKLTESH